MEILPEIWKQHVRPRTVVGYGGKVFLPSPPNYVTRSSSDVTAAMLVYRTEQCCKMSFGNLTLLLWKNLWNHFLLFCTPTWASHHVDENQG